MEVISLVGLALWALLPGFIAKKKGRNFWAYYFLSFLITPLFTTLLIICLPPKTEKYYLEENPDRLVECLSCGYREKHFNTCPNCGSRETQYVYTNDGSTIEADAIHFCRKCGERLIPNSRFCRKCGTEIVEKTFF